MIQTRASIANLRADSHKITEDFKAITHETNQLKKTKVYKEKISKTNDEEATDDEFEAIFGDGPSMKKKKKPDDSVFNYKTARNEVINFGMSGFDAKSKQSAQVELAIKLGARPLKQKHKNYKEFLAEKKLEKVETSKINPRTIFGASASLQLRGQNKKGYTAGKKKDDGLLQRYGKVEKPGASKFKNNSRKSKR